MALFKDRTDRFIEKNIAFAANVWASELPTDIVEHDFSPSFEARMAAIRKNHLSPMRILLIAALSALCLISAAAAGNAEGFVLKPDGYSRTFYFSDQRDADQPGDVFAAYIPDGLIEVRRTYDRRIYTVDYTFSPTDLEDGHRGDLHIEAEWAAPSGRVMHSSSFSTGVSLQTLYIGVEEAVYVSFMGSHQLFFQKDGFLVDITADDLISKDQLIKTAESLYFK